MKQLKLKNAFVWTLGLALLCGAVLRVQQLTGQALVDDEWHTLAFVLDRPLGWILTHFAVPSGFTSIPLNLYAWALLHTVGWSELMLRLPSLVFGLLLLVLGPWWASGLIGQRAARWLALLLAVSPLLIFYARLARPYSAVACLGFLAILAAAQWARSGKTRDGLIYAVCGFLTVYHHPFAAITIGTMGLYVLGVSVAQAKRGRREPLATGGLRWQQVVLILVSTGLLGAAMMLPALLDSLKHSMDDVAKQGAAQFSSWTRLLELFCGTSNGILVAIVLALALCGLAQLIRVRRGFGITIALLFPLQACGLVVMGPHSSHVGIVLARYSIVLLPIVLMLAAFGFQTACEKLASKRKVSELTPVVCSAGLVLALLLTGPLLRLWPAPNTFTNHGVFQHDYGPIDWRHSFISEFTPKGFAIRTRVDTEELSGFYGFLREHRSGRPIVEYPMMIGDHFNLHYFSQWYHLRPVLVGYAIGLTPPGPLAGGGVYGNTYVDDVLNLAPDPAVLNFRIHVAMTDFERMRSRDVEYIIIHKRFEAEFAKLAPPPSAMVPLLALYRDTCHLVYEDAFVAVFSLDANSARLPSGNRGDVK